MGRPFMRLVLRYDFLEAHEAPVTALHTSAQPSHWTRLWSGDKHGAVIAWALSSDDHWVKDSEVCFLVGLAIASAD